MPPYTRARACEGVYERSRRHPRARSDRDTRVRFSACARTPPYSRALAHAGGSARVCAPLYASTLLTCAHGRRHTRIISRTYAQVRRTACVRSRSRSHKYAHARHRTRVRSRSRMYIRLRTRVSGRTYAAKRAYARLHARAYAPVGEYVHVRRRTYDAIACTLVGVRVPTPPDASVLVCVRIQARTAGTTLHTYLKDHPLAQARARTRPRDPMHACVRQRCPYAIGGEAYLHMVPGGRTCAQVRHHTYARCTRGGSSPATRTYSGAGT